MTFLNAIAWLLVLVANIDDLFSAFLTYLALIPFTGSLIFLILWLALEAIYDSLVVLSESDVAELKRKLKELEK